MADELNVFDNASARKIAEMYSWYMSQRGKTDLRDQSIQPQKAPDCYIARVPSGGIPALTTGTPDIAGSATCDIYRATLNGSNWEISEIEDLDKTVLNLSLTPVTGRYVLVHRIKGGQWATSRPESDLVSLQSATADTTLSGVSATMPVGNGADILPSWLTIVSDEIIIADSVIGCYLQFSGILGIKRTTDPPTTINAGTIEIQNWDTFGPGYIVAWQERFYLNNNVNHSQETRCPSFSWGPIQSGDKFKITASQTAGSDTIKFMGGVSDMRLDILLLRTKGYGTRVQG